MDVPGILVSHDHTPSEKSEGSGILPVPFSFFSPRIGRQYLVVYCLRDVCGLIMNVGRNTMQLLY